MTDKASAQQPFRIIGRYALFEELASGGMATVHMGRLIGPVGFSRTVAIKCLHPYFARDPAFVTMFLDEAMLAARIHHPNVVQTLDIVVLDGEVFLVMDYVLGETLSRLSQASRETNRGIPPSVATSIMLGVLHGLHAAHEARSDMGEPLNIVHRDVSPQNIMVGSDGVARVLDFGIAKSIGRSQATGEGRIKGKLAYMAPEQAGGTVTRQVDVYAASVVLWELLAGRRLFEGETPQELLARVVTHDVRRPSLINPSSPRAFDDLVLKGLAIDPANRFQTARDFAGALERVARPASQQEVGRWVEVMARESLTRMERLISKVETATSLGISEGWLTDRMNGRIRAEDLDTTDEEVDDDPTRAFLRDEPPGLSPEDSSVGPAESPPSIAEPTVAKRPDLWRIAALVLFIGLPLTWYLASSRQAPRTAGVNLASGVASAHGSTTTFAVPPPALSVSVTQPATSAVRPAASAAPSARVQGAARAAQTGSTSGNATRLSQPTPANVPGRPPKVDCSPPFRIDKDGIRHLKPECM